MFNADIILFAAMAIFIAWRLRAVLGKKIDVEKRPQTPDEILKRRNQQNRQDGAYRPQSHPSLAKTVQPVVEAEDLSALDANVANIISQIKKFDPSFTAASFLKGAKAAFEMVLDAFASADRKTLANLLSAEVYKTFDSEIAQREKNNETLQTTLISIEDAKISGARMKGSTAQIDVTFFSEQINILKDQEGEIVDGDPSLIERIEDSWVFERDLKSSNPNWKLVSTQG